MPLKTLNGWQKKKIEDFMRYDLNDVNSHLGEVKEAIDDVNVFKKIWQE